MFDKNDKFSEKVTRVIVKSRKKNLTLAQYQDVKQTLAWHKDCLKKVYNKLSDQTDILVKKDLEQNKDYPAWYKELIEHDANPVNFITDQEFATAKGITVQVMDNARAKYPGYSIAVALSRKKFNSDLQNFTLKLLVGQAIQGSPSATTMLAEISGLYEVKSSLKINKDTDEHPDVKKQKISDLLKKLQHEHPSTNVPEQKNEQKSSDKA